MQKIGDCNTGSILGGIQPEELISTTMVLITKGDREFRGIVMVDTI